MSEDALISETNPTLDLESDCVYVDSHPKFPLLIPKLTNHLIEIRTPHKTLGELSHALAIHGTRFRVTSANP